MTTVDTPDGLYCKLPQDAPIGVRGARNYPCQGKPGKRAPTAEMCNSDKPYVPLAMRQHALGPNPIDPNLIAQGIPPDERIDPSANIYGPVQGTPLPPGVGEPGPPADSPPPGAAPAAPVPMGAAPDEAPPVGAPQAPADAPPPGPVPVPADAPQAAPSSFGDNGSGGPSVAMATYNPKTGQYATPDGHVFTQADLAEQGPPKSWKDMLPVSG
jgi:hypothetical protein